MASRNPVTSIRLLTLLLATLLSAGLAHAAEPFNGGESGLGDGGLTDGFLDLELTPLELGALTLGVSALAFLAYTFFTGGTKYVNADNVLENDARRTIFEYIQENPGVHLRATAQALDLSTTNVLWHLRKLEGAKLVSSKKVEGYKVFYPVEGGVDSKRRALAAAALKNDNARGILEYLSARPGAHQREIARALGVNHGTVRWHLRKLRDNDLVQHIKNDHTTEYFVADLGHEFLIDAETASRRPVELATPGRTPPKVPPTADTPDES